MAFAAGADMTVRGGSFERMADPVPSIRIVEKSSPLKTEIKRIGDEIAQRPTQPIPVVAWWIPRKEWALLNDAIHRLWQRYLHARKVRGMPADPELLPLTIDLAYRMQDGSLAQALPTDDHRYGFVLLITEEDPGDLLAKQQLTPEFHARIFKTYRWPETSYRTASMKRDYFLQHVADANQKAGNALTTSSKARELLHGIFAEPDRGRMIEDVQQCADAYLANLGTGQYPVETLENFVTRILDGSRETELPDEQDVSAA